MQTLGIVSINANVFPAIITSNPCEEIEGLAKACEKAPNSTKIAAACWTGSHLKRDRASCPLIFHALLLHIARCMQGNENQRQRELHGNQGLTPTHSLSA